MEFRFRFVENDDNDPTARHREHVVRVAKFTHKYRIATMFFKPLVFVAALAFAIGSQSPASGQVLVGPRSDNKLEASTKPSEDHGDLTLLRRISARTYVHEAARVSYTLPDNWKQIAPHRLARGIDRRISTVLGIENLDRDLIGSLYWIPMNPGQRLSNWVRETAVDGEFGEEYETLKAVYGKARVSTPVKFKHGPFDMYRINIRGGPEGGTQHDGSLFAFEVESGGTTTWLLKARVSYPKGDWGRNDQFAQEMLSGYRRLSEKAGSEMRKSPDGEALAPGSVDLESVYLRKR